MFGEDGKYIGLYSTLVEVPAEEREILEHPVV
jgi:hypothetical protein